MVTGIEFWSVTFDFLGKFMIAATALLTHRRMIIEKKLDDLVFKDLRLEVSIGFLGVIFLIVGYALKVWSF
jgi:hypothetical protein